MNPISRFVSWLLSLSEGGDVRVPPVYTGTRRRYARGTCERCGKTLAMTKDGRLWSHTCNGVETRELDATPYPLPPRVGNTVTVRPPIRYADSGSVAADPNPTITATLDAHTRDLISQEPTR